MNHLVQKRRDTKYVLRAMLYTAISTSQNPFGKSLRKVRLYWDISIETWISIKKNTLFILG